MDDTRMPSDRRDHRAPPRRTGDPDKSVDIRRSHDHMTPEIHRGAYVRVFKPGMDRILGVILIFLTLPLLLLIALIVRVKLGRGILFRQERVGLDGRPFIMYKFRSMRPDRRVADLPFEGGERRVRHKSPSDPRHTHCGRVLRATSLDELPQLWNVVRGDMSLVGPRPELVSVVETYEPWQHQRHVVKPGLTGLWQVGRREGDGLMRDDTDIDLDYIRQLSIVVDLRILLTTIPVVLSRSGS